MWTRIWSRNLVSKSRKTATTALICWCRALARPSNLPGQAVEQLRGNRVMKPVFRSKNGLVFGPQFRVRCIEFASRTSAPRTPFGHASNHLRVMIAQLLHPASPPYQAHPCGEIVATAVSSNITRFPFLSTAAVARSWMPGWIAKKWGAA